MVAITVTSNVKEWEAFHSFAGEIMFLPWIGIYLTAVIFLENKLEINACILVVPLLNLYKNGLKILLH